MKLILPVVALLVLSACQPATPDFTDVNGDGHRYSDFDGKFVIVNYWATWCGPCIKEIPELNKLASDHKDKLVMLGVNYDEPGAKAGKQQADKMRIAFPVYASDPAKRLGIETPEVLPTTFVFGPDLKLRDTLVGPQTEATILAAMKPASQPAPSS